MAKSYQIDPDLPWDHRYQCQNEDCGAVFKEKPPYCPECSRPERFELHYTRGTFFCQPWFLDGLMS